MKLPNLVGVGVEKCGTTLVYEWLSHHLQVLTPRKKELFFFNQNYGLGVDWYLNWYEDSGNWRYKVDITPSYFRNVRTLQRIRSHLPDAKIVLVVRHPVERAFSHYVHRIRHVALQPGGYVNSFWDEVESGTLMDNLFPLYARKLGPILDLFPRSNVLVLLYEHDILHPEVGAAKLYDFLELDIPAEMSLLTAPVNPGCMPTFEYRSAGRVDHFENGGKGSLIFHHAKGEKQLTSGDNKRAQELINTAMKWTSGISASESRRLYDSYFAKDSEEFARMFEIDIGRWQVFRDVTYPVAGRG